jgi:hypothetical protein
MRAILPDPPPLHKPPHYPIIATQEATHAAHRHHHGRLDQAGE